MGRKEMTKFLFLLSPNLVISYYIYQIRHLIIISALLTKKKGQEEIDCVSSKYTPIQRFEKRPKKSLFNARNARPILPLKKTTEHLVTKRTKISPRDGVFSQKNKKESFLPPLKTKQNKNFPYQIERKKKKLKVELKEKKNGLRENQTF